MCTIFKEAWFLRRFPPDSVLLSGRPPKKWRHKMSANQEELFTFLLI